MKKKIPSNITLSPTRAKFFTMCKECNRSITNGKVVYIEQIRSLKFGDKGRVLRSREICQECKEILYGQT